jgi:thiamine-phosphate pyrophosphorylase
MAENFKLIIITPEKDIAGEAGIVNGLFGAGLELLHIRKPNHTIEETRNMLKAISVVFYPKIVLHNHYELLDEFNLKGAHLPERVRKGASTSWIKNIISTSFHAMEDILPEKINFDHAFLSPIFQSISKHGHNPSMDPNTLKNFLLSHKSEIQFPVIALGGVTDKSILQAQDMGFSGAACIGYIWKSPAPIEQFKKLQKIIQS